MKIKIACVVQDMVGLDDLVPFQGDLKSLSKEDFAALRKEIVTTGFAFPVHVWQSPEGIKYIIGGHQRVKVLKAIRDELGLGNPPVPVVYILADSVEEAKRRVLQDVAQYGKVEKQGLYEFIHESRMSHLELASFRMPDIDLKKFEIEFFKKPEVPNEDPGVQMPAQARVLRGEVWSLGAHTLMCGDSTSPTDVETLMGSDRADLIWTDPPYNVDYTGKTKDALQIQNDKMSAVDFFDFLKKAFTNMATHTKPGGGIYICHADTEGLNFRRAMVDSGFLLKQVIVWVKQSIVMGRQDYHWQHEPILYGWREGGSHHWHGDRKQSTVWNIDRPSRSTEHPTMKPIELVQKALENSSEHDQIVMDLFGGSGSTLIACQKTGRRCRTMEIDPIYADVIITRYAGLTGQDPIRHDGTRWSELCVKPLPEPVSG